VDLPARSFDLARPGVAPPLSTTEKIQAKIYPYDKLILLTIYNTIRYAGIILIISGHFLYLLVGFHHSVCRAGCEDIFLDPRGRHDQNTAAFVFV